MGRSPVPTTVKTEYRAARTSLNGDAPGEQHSLGITRRWLPIAFGWLSARSLVRDASSPPARRRAAGAGSVDGPLAARVQSIAGPTITWRRTGGVQRRLHGDGFVRAWRHECEPGADPRPQHRRARTDCRRLPKPVAAPMPQSKSSTTLSPIGTRWCTSTASTSIDRGGSAAALKPQRGSATCRRADRAVYMAVLACSLGSIEHEYTAARGEQCARQSLHSPLLQRLPTRERVRPAVHRALTNS